MSLSTSGYVCDVASGSLDYTTWVNVVVYGLFKCSSLQAHVLLQ